MGPATALIPIQIAMCVVPAAFLAPSSCSDLMRDSRGNGWYTIDPDLDGQEAFLVFCNMTSDPVTAILHHNQESVYKVEGYGEQESYVAQIIFNNNVATSQARRLVMTSISCSYYLSVTCEKTDIEAHSGTSYYGSTEHFLFLKGIFCTNGFGSRTCICGVEEISNAPGDTGDAGNWPCLPILSLNFGDTNNIGKEFVEYSVGPLVCKQAESVYRWFDVNVGKRLNVEVTTNDRATTAGKCAMNCLSTDNCISFNFKKYPLPICELSSLPWRLQITGFQLDGATTI